MNQSSTSYRRWRNMMPEVNDESGDHPTSVDSSVQSNNHMAFIQKRERKMGIPSWICDATIMVYYRGILPSVDLVLA